MLTIGNRAVNLYTVDKDATTYVGPTHTNSHSDKVDLRRTLPKQPVTPLRTNVRFERGFPVPAVGSYPAGERNVLISIAVTVPPGVVTGDVETFITDSLTQAAALAGNLGITGDIHLSA